MASIAAIETYLIGKGFTKVSDTPLRYRNDNVMCDLENDTLTLYTTEKNIPLKLLNILIDKGFNIVWKKIAFKPIAEI